MYKRQGNQNESVKLLLKNGVDPNKELAGVTPLIMAIRNKDAKIVETLISYGADVNKEAAYTKPLAYAIQKKQPKIVEQLINAGAKPDLSLIHIYHASWFLRHPYNSEQPELPERCV